MRERAIVAVIASALGLGGSGCSLILDFSDPPGATDASVPDAIDSAACAFGEPDDTQATAFPLSPGLGQAAGICTLGDRDYYAITVAAGQTMTFTVHFDQVGTVGDLDEKLFDSTGATVANSLSADSDESITCPGDNPPCIGLAAGTYVVEVYGFGDTNINGYSIDYTLQ